LSIDFLF